MLGRPRLPVAPDPVVTQQELRQPVPGTGPVGDQVRAGPAQVPDRLLNRRIDASSLKIFSASGDTSSGRRIPTRIVFLLVSSPRWIGPAGRAIPVITAGSFRWLLPPSVDDPRKINHDEAEASRPFHAD
jgi:hypothetical protein